MAGDRQHILWAGLVLPALTPFRPAALRRLQFAGAPYSFEKPGSPRDYKALAAAMRRDWRAEDLVFVFGNRWEEAPLFYYLPEARYVCGDYAAALLAELGARIRLLI